MLKLYFLNNNKMDKNLAKQIYEIEVENLINAKTVFDGEVFNGFVDTVFETNKNWGRIIMSWVWKNSFIAAKTAATMSSIWIPAFYLDTNDALHGDLWMITNKDFVIHLSRSWNTDEMLHTAFHIKKLWYKQWALTCREDCKVKEYVDLFLPIPFIKEADVNWLAPSSSSTLLLAVCDVIWLTVSAMKWFTREDFFSFHPGGALWAMLKNELSK